MRYIIQEMQYYITVIQKESDETGDNLYICFEDKDKEIGLIYADSKTVINNNNVNITFEYNSRQYFFNTTLDKISVIDGKICKIIVNGINTEDYQQIEELFPIQENEIKLIEMAIKFPSRDIVVVNTLFTRLNEEDDGGRYPSEYNFNFDFNNSSVDEYIIQDQKFYIGSSFLSNFSSSHQITNCYIKLEEQLYQIPSSYFITPNNLPDSLDLKYSYYVPMGQGYILSNYYYDNNDFDALFTLSLVSKEFSIDYYTTDNWSLDFIAANDISIQTRYLLPPSSERDVDIKEIIILDEQYSSFLEIRDFPDINNGMGFYLISNPGEGIPFTRYYDQSCSVKNIFEGLDINKSNTFVDILAYSIPTGHRHEVDFERILYKKMRIRIYPTKWGNSIYGINKTINLVPNYENGGSFSLFKGELYDEDTYDLDDFDYYLSDEVSPIEFENGEAKFEDILDDMLNVEIYAKIKTAFYSHGNDEDEYTKIAYIKVNFFTGPDFYPNYIFQDPKDFWDGYYHTKDWNINYFSQPPYWNIISVESTNAAIGVEKNEFDECYSFYWEDNNITFDEIPLKLTCESNDPTYETNETFQRAIEVIDLTKLSFTPMFNTYKTYHPLQKNSYGKYTFEFKFQLNYNFNSYEVLSGFVNNLRLDLKREVEDAFLGREPDYYFSLIQEEDNNYILLNVNLLGVSTYERFTYSLKEQTTDIKFNTGEILFNIASLISPPKIPEKIPTRFIDKDTRQINIPFIFEDYVAGSFECEAQIMNMNNKLIATLKESNLSTIKENAMDANFNLVLNENENFKIIDLVNNFYKIVIRAGKNGVFSPWSNVGVFKVSYKPYIVKENTANDLVSNKITYIYAQDPTESLEKIKYNYIIQIPELNEKIELPECEFDHIVAQKGINSYTFTLKTPLDFKQFRDLIKKYPYEIYTYQLIPNIFYYTKNGIYEDDQNEIVFSFKVKEIDVDGMDFIEMNCKHQNLLNRDDNIIIFNNDIKISGNIDYTPLWYNNYDGYIFNKNDNCLYYRSIEEFNNYDGIYLIDVHSGKQLNITLNNKVSSFKHTLLETKTDTIGNKYPKFYKNKNTNYREFTLNGMISYQSLLLFDNYFDNLLSNYKIIDNKNLSRSQGVVSQSNSTHLTQNNIYSEYKFREAVLDFLKNNQPLLYKSQTEGNIVVKIMNISLTPEEKLGRMIYNFSCTCYEVQDLEEYLQEG